MRLGFIFYFNFPFIMKLFLFTIVTLMVLFIIDSKSKRCPYCKGKMRKSDIPDTIHCTKCGYYAKC